MKFRLIASIVMLSLALSACNFSLTEDITPPPDYHSPTAPVATLQPSITPLSPSETISSITPSPVTTAEVSISAVTPSVDLTGNPVTLVTVSGTVTNASDGALPEGMMATLHIDTATQEIGVQTVPLQPDGSYTFSDIAMMPETALLVSVDYYGVTYSSKMAVYGDVTTQYNLPVTIYEATTDMNALRLDQVHIFFDFSTEGAVQVVEVYVIRNPGSQAVTISYADQTLPFIQLPADAQNIGFQLTQDSASLNPATDGFAIMPGPDKQYGFVAHFDFPYDRQLELIQPFLLPTASLTVFTPEGVKVGSDRLTDGGTSDLQGTMYHLYTAENLAVSESLSLTISGSPKSGSSGGVSTQTNVVIGMGALGIILIGAGVYLYLRDRNRKYEDDETEHLPDDPDSLADAIITLEEQYEAGDISKEDYEKRRTELKERLKEIL
jgi:uncharacterized membrane protein